MIKLGIIGYPLGHSLSPSMHNAALKEAGIEGNYSVLETPLEGLEERVKFFKEQNFRGFNVTIPHKVEIMKFLDSVDPFAKSIGAVNTVVIDNDKKLHGYNTDVYGFVNAISQDIRANLKGKKAALIGSGGAARAVLAGLIEMGVSTISIFARNQEKAKELQSSFSVNKENMKICLNSLENENTDLSVFSVVVNTTPLGMQGKNEGVSPLSEECIATLPQDALVYDIIYKPRKTKLLEYAEKRGLKILDGLEMLVLQGAKGFELWTGKKPSVEVMRDSLLKIFN